ncbi:hypothetical protein E2C01_063253 [Portunus trituberculatus]|uniref:Uncharacterized protein n=1 Tax=Portunus trituberculatus TaxID=210409 RepID=A0A5B7H9Z8_PORTR|nr:hypothetical protein [Portunus trituberculatus]
MGLAAMTHTTLRDWCLSLQGEVGTIPISLLPCSLMSVSPRRLRSCSPPSPQRLFATIG